MALEEQGLAEVILKKLGMPNKKPNLDTWKKIVESAKNPTHKVKVGIIGECDEVNDAYLSVVESLKHAGYELNTQIDIKWIASDECTDLQKAKENSEKGSNYFDSILNKDV